jgi:serine/threonine protein kinase
MRTCESCGFENAEPGKACALCGASEVVTPRPDDLATLEMSRRSGGGGAEEGRRAAAVGRVYAGRYRVDAFIGSGGMGQVFRVHDLEAGQDLALKVLHPLVEDDADRNDRFRREIGILAKIRHPAVPRIHGWGTEDDALFFVSDLIDGHDLKADIQARGAWPPADAAPLAATVSDALAAAHALGIVHRDVKPNNIMLAGDGSVRLLDFGLARGRGVDMTTLTRTGTIVGTPGYMSPEQFDGYGVDERSDLYSLGVVLFELLTARLPFTGQTPIAVAMKHKTEPPPSPRSLRREVPAWLDRLVLQCLEKDPARRFGSAAELASELRRPRTGAGPRRRRLPSGDLLVEDDSEASDWSLVLAAPEEKSGWAAGMALRFSDRYYRLSRIAAPSEASGRWTYSFAAWPDGEVFRRIVDYEQDCAEREAARKAGLGGRLQKWIRGRDE